MSDTPMTPQDIEAAYDQTRWASNMQQVLARCRFMSGETRTAIGEPTRISYGVSEVEGLDLYRVDRERAPIVVFVHGGGWRGGEARDHGFLAEMLHAAGIHFAPLDFSSVIDAKGDLAVLVDQVRRALVWLCRNCSSFGGDADRIFVVGHSSGAHLAAMALSTHWTDHGLRPDPIRGGVLVSGIYDLGPLRQTSRSEYVRIDDRVERESSPLHQIAGITSPLLVAAASGDSPEFQRQARDYAEAVARSGKQVKAMVVENYNHFEILETLGNPYGLLGRSVLKFISTGSV